ncbi:MAG: SDR family NAD(P)-dependent oxidoreductase, partial [Xanthobacteraceae bacterium]
MPQRVLITAGAKVLVCDIDTSALDAIAKEIPGVIARRYDMARRAEIEHMVPVAVAHLGGLDVLINNAGI